MQKYFSIVLSFLLGIAVGFGASLLVIPRTSLPDSPTSGDIAPLRSGTTAVVNATTSRYQNTHYGFSLLYPPEFLVKEFDEGDDRMTIVFQKVGEKRGLQIFVTPYDKATIEQSQILLDVPRAELDALTEVIIGDNTRALHFTSEVPGIGESVEVWFIHGGYLFEVTSYRALDTWLAGILATLTFP